MSFAALIIGLIIILFGFDFSEIKEVDLEASVPDPTIVPTLKKIQSVEEEYPHVLEKNISLYAYLTDLGVPPLDVIQMVKAAKTAKNLSRLNPGIRFQTSQDEKNQLTQIKFRFSPLEKLLLTKSNEDWTVKTIREKVDVKPISFVGEVDSSLWGSAKSANMDPYLIVALSEVFGWEIDFSREVRLGDKWRITAERKFVGSEPVGWGSILAAEYLNAGTSHKAVLFRLEGRDMGYYDLQGENLRRMFLKSPLRFGRITSRFNKRRFHPKLKRIRPHNGVDYGAPIGTPVRAVADGKVTFSKYRGGGGKTLKIKHNSTYKTAYKHLSRFGKGIRPGVKVKQGQVVAYVGNTGLSTGPHLHYEFFVNNRFVDPLKQKFPSADPIEKKYRADFKIQSTKMIASLPPWSGKNFVLLASQKVWTQGVLDSIRELKPLIYRDTEASL